jgi:hypothetical protein
VHHRDHRPELADLAHQAASDAMVAILAKLETFRGDSRFTTWMYKFVILEISAKYSSGAIGRLVPEDVAGVVRYPRFQAAA